MGYLHDQSHSTINESQHQYCQTREKFWLLLSSNGSLFLSLAAVLPALAAAPAVGIVCEGFGVSGIELGFTRAQVEAAYGQPKFCQSVTSGDFASFSFNVGGAGTALDVVLSSIQVVEGISRRGLFGSLVVVVGIAITVGGALPRPPGKPAGHALCWIRSW